MSTLFVFILFPSWTEVMMKKRNRNTPAASAELEARYGAIADAARQEKLSKSWRRAMGNDSRRGIRGVKLHAGWDAAFRRVRTH
ncbi:hypothetical protein [Burkholderia contaminans]|nr:hypothetical protein [Burkholderia contaminans]